VIERLHGMSPFSGTPLDAMLRSEGAQAVVATGVSLNVAILGLTIEAANLGYEVIIPTDCVAGIPIEYGEAILANTLGYLATLTTSKGIIAAWSLARSSARGSASCD
jgi:nicotinamidase-related amidase